MGSSQHARTLSRRCVESDPKVCRERPKGKEKSASSSRLRRSSDIWKPDLGSDATHRLELVLSVVNCELGRLSRISTVQRVCRGTESSIGAPTWCAVSDGQQGVG